MKPFPELESARLVLRELYESDALSIFNYFSKDEVTKFYDLETFTRQNQALELVNIWRRRFEQGVGIRWGIVLKQEKTSTLIGTCGFHNFSKENSRIETGFELHPDYWNRGIMTEAVSTIIDYGFNTLNLHRIEAFIDPQHEVSEKLLERLGFSAEGLLRDYFFEKSRFIDAKILSILNAIKV